MNRYPSDSSDSRAAADSDPGFDAAEGSFHDIEASASRAGDDEAPAFGAAIDAAPAGDKPRSESRARRAAKKAKSAKRTTKRARPSRSKTREPEPDEAALEQAPSPDVEPESDADAAEAPKSRGRSRRGRSRSRRSEAPPEEVDAEAQESAPAPPARADDADDGDEDRDEDREDRDERENSEADGEPRRKRRRGTRGGRRRKRSRARSETDGEAPAPERSRKQPDEGPAVLGLEAIPGEEDELGDDSGMEEGHLAIAPTRRRRSRGRGRKKRVVESDDEGPKRKVTARRKHSDESEAESGRKKRRRGRRSKAESDEVEDAPAKEPVRDQVILVNAHDPDETRVVCVEKERIVDLQMTVDHHKSFVNDIYRGRVVNLETNIGAAFVDFGQGKNGFLHLSDVMDFYGEDDFSLDRLLEARTDEEEWENRGSAAGDADANADSDPEEPEDDEEDEEQGSGSRRGRGRSKSSKSKAKSKVAKQRSKPRRGRSRRAIGDLLSKGQLVVCQITKDAIGDKGPTLTTFISIPGRYLVLMPSLQRTGVSRKIEDEKERRRLKRILQGLETPENMGVIVRTAGIGKTKADIKRDLDYLLAVWKQFSKSLVLGRAPAPLYQESDVAIRTMRDMFSSRTKAVIVDDEAVYEKMREFTTKLMPEHLERIELHTDEKPLFHHYSIEQDFEKIFSRRVELPSGGSIVIDQTEALVAIDVNSGRTRDEGAGFEDIALKTNLEAAAEISRQIKLRDMGGILVLDFIDMMRASSRRRVENAFRDHLVSDRARSKVGRISQFGLLELTRQRLGPGLSKLLYEPCSTCRGSGRRRTAQSRAQALLRRLGSALTQKGFTKIEILAHPDTIQWLKKQDATELKELETRSKRELIFKPVENQVEDSIFHYLRADGREVRPGGRRKR